MFLHRISKNVWVEKWPWMVSNSQETQRVFKCYCFSWEFNQCVKSPNWVWAIRTEDLFMISSLAFKKAFICLQKEVLCLQLRVTWHAVWLYVHMDGREVLRSESQPYSSESDCGHLSTTKEVFSGSCSRAGTGGARKEPWVSLRLRTHPLEDFQGVSETCFGKGQVEKPHWALRRQDLLGRSLGAW